MWWVVNASPVILLAKIGHADLLLRLPDHTAIPASAAAEIRAAPLISALKAAGAHISDSLIQTALQLVGE